MTFKHVVEEYKEENQVTIEQLIDQPNKIPSEDRIINLKDGEEVIIFIKDRPFLVSKATDDDIERVGKGIFVMD